MDLQHRKQKIGVTSAPLAKFHMITENLIDSYVSQGATAFSQGQFQAAGRLFLAAYQKSKSLSKTDPKLAVVYANLSLFYYQQKRYRKAENLLEQALAILTDNNLLHSDFAEKVRVQMSNVYLAQNKHVQLIKHYKACLSFFLSASKLADASAAYNRIVDLYIALDRMKDAEIWCRQAVEFDKEHSAQSDPIAKKRLIKMAWIYTRLGRTDDACRIYNSSVHQEKEHAAFMRPAMSQSTAAFI